MFDTRAVQQQPISLALVVEPKAQQLVLHGLCRRTWRVHAACGAREARGGGPCPMGRPEGVLARAAEVGLQWAQHEVVSR